MIELWLVHLHRERATTLWLLVRTRPVSSSSEALMPWLCWLGHCRVVQVQGLRDEVKPWFRRKYFSREGCVVSMCCPGTYNIPICGGKITFSEDCFHPQPTSCCSVLPFWLSQVCGMCLSLSALFRSLMGSGNLAICISRMKFIPAQKQA